MIPNLDTTLLTKLGFSDANQIPEFLALSYNKTLSTYEQLRKSAPYDSISNLLTFVQCFVSKETADEFLSNYCNENGISLTYGERKKIMRSLSREPLENIGACLFQLVIESEIPKLDDRSTIKKMKKLKKCFRHLKFDYLEPLGLINLAFKDREDEVELSIFLSLVAAIFQESDFRTVQLWVLSLFNNFIDVKFTPVVTFKITKQITVKEELITESTPTVSVNTLPEPVPETDNGADYISQLINYCRRSFKQDPRFQILRETGPSHLKEFEIGVSLAGKVILKAIGSSKKRAKAKAACSLLKKLESLDTLSNVAMLSKIVEDSVDKKIAPVTKKQKLETPVKNENLLIAKEKNIEAYHDSDVVLKDEIIII